MYQQKMYRINKIKNMSTKKNKAIFKALIYTYAYTANLNETFFALS
jgi:hypothetical protein